MLHKILYFLVDIDALIFWYWYPWRCGTQWRDLYQDITSTGEILRCSEATQSFSRFDIIKDDLMNYFDEKIKMIIKVWRCDSPAGAGCRGLCLRKLLGVSLSRWGKSASNLSLLYIDIKNQPYLGNGLCYLLHITNDTWRHCFKRRNLGLIRSIISREWDSIYCI